MRDSTNMLPRQEGAEHKRRSLLTDLLIRLVREKPLGAAGGVIVLILLVVGIFANFLAPYPYTEIHLSDQLSSYSGEYLLGTDNLGRDQLSRIIRGARVSVIIGLSAAALTTVVATIIGLSGFFSGKIDITAQRFVDAVMCFPFLFLVLTLMALTGPGMFQVIMVVGITAGIHNSRVVRSAIIVVNENVYVEAARAIGSPTSNTLRRHILPNVMAVLIVIFSLNVGNAILTEAMMSFLGFGVPPPEPTWGGMLSWEGRKYMLFAPWLAIWPGVALAVTVYSINVLGDALRDTLDPRLRGGMGRYGGEKRQKPAQT